jgi:hypothetical protein
LQGQWLQLLYVGLQCAGVKPIKKNDVASGGLTLSSQVIPMAKGHHVNIVHQQSCTLMYNCSLPAVLSVYIDKMQTISGYSPARQHQSRTEWHIVCGD